MSKPKLVIGALVSGRGSNVQKILDGIISGQLHARVAVVISNRESAQALERARAHGVPACWIDPMPYTAREDYDRAIVEVLERHAVEVVVLAGYMRIVSSVLIHAYKNRIMNIHPSLLPAFPGLHAQKQALDWGVKVSGCTVHFVDEKLDGGPIILQAAVPVEEGDTEETLAARILEQEHRIYPKALQLFGERRLTVVGRRVVIRD